MEEKIRELVSKIHPEVSQIPPARKKTRLQLHAAFRPTKHTLEIGSDGARLLIPKATKTMGRSRTFARKQHPRMARLFSLVTG